MSVKHTMEPALASDGFSLIEALVATAVLAITVMSLALVAGHAEKDRMALASKGSFLEVVDDFNTALWVSLKSNCQSAPQSFPVGASGIARLTSSPPLPGRSPVSPAYQAAVQSCAGTPSVNVAGGSYTLCYTLAANAGSTPSPRTFLANQDILVVARVQLLNLATNTNIACAALGPPPTIVGPGADVSLSINWFNQSIPGLQGFQTKYSVRYVAE